MSAKDKHDTCESSTHDLNNQHTATAVNLLRQGETKGCRGQPTARFHKNLDLNLNQMWGHCYLYSAKSGRVTKLDCGDYNFRLSYLPIAECVSFSGVSGACCMAHCLVCLPAHCGTGTMELQVYSIQPTTTSGQAESAYIKR